VYAHLADDTLDLGLIQTHKNRQRTGTLGLLGAQGRGQSLGPNIASGRQRRRTRRRERERERKREGERAARKSPVEVDERERVAVQLRPVRGRF